MLKRIAGGEKGFGLIEALVSIAILGIIAAAFLMALVTASRAVLISDERTTAESLAKSQMESIKLQYYNEAGMAGTGIYVEISLADHPSFSISSKDMAGTLVEDIVGVPVFGQQGLQKVTLVIYNNTKELFTLEGYKADRQ